MCVCLVSACQNLDFCIITVPMLSPEFLLLQNFLRVPHRITSLLPYELYIFPRTGLRWVILVSFCLLLIGSIGTSLCLPG